MEVPPFTRASEVRDGGHTFYLSGCGACSEMGSYGRGWSWSSNMGFLWKGVGLAHKDSSFLQINNN